MPHICPDLAHESFSLSMPDCSENLLWVSSFALFYSFGNRVNCTLSYWLLSSCQYVCECVCVCASECECCVLPWHFPLRITLLNGFTCATQSAYIKSLIHPIRSSLQSQPQPQRLKLCNVGHGWKEAHTKIHKASETAVERGQSKEGAEGEWQINGSGQARSKFGDWLGAPIIQFNHAKCPFTWGGVNYSPLLLLPPSPFHQAMTKFLSRAEANEVICMHDNCYCIFFGARANIKIDKMPSNTALPPRLLLLPTDWVCSQIELPFYKRKLWQRNLCVGAT